MEDVVDVMMEAISLLPDETSPSFHFLNTASDNANRLFEHGCDYLSKQFEDEMQAKLSK
jgi:hypothetical protein